MAYNECSCNLKKWNNRRTIDKMICLSIMRQPEMTKTLDTIIQTICIIIICIDIMIQLRMITTVNTAIVGIIIIMWL